MPVKPCPGSIIKAGRDRVGVSAHSCQNHESNRPDRYEDVNKPKKNNRIAKKTILKTTLQKGGAASHTITPARTMD